MARENQFTQECTEMIKCWYKPWMDIAELNTRMFSELTNNAKLTEHLESLTKAKSLTDVWNAQADFLNNLNESMIPTHYVDEITRIFKEQAEEMKEHFDKLNEEYNSAASQWMQTTKEAAHKFTPPQPAKAKKHAGRTK